MGLMETLAFFILSRRRRSLMIQPLLSQGKDNNSEINQEIQKQGRSAWNSPSFNLATILWAI